jgi:diguanylate cyclase (GGDEF)-like protein
MPLLSQAALLVEDSKIDFLHTRAMLLGGGTGIKRLDWVQEWTSAADALANGPYDLFLIDINLGPLSGLDVIRALRSVGVLAPIIALTGHSDDRTDRACTEVGASDFLVKGEFDQRSLERSIRYATRSTIIHRELDRVNAMLERRAVADAATSSGRLRDAVEVMSDGFALFDAELRLIVWNSRFAFFFRSVAEMLQPTASFQDILLCAAQRGAFDDVDASNARGFADLRIRQAQKGNVRSEHWMNGTECIEILQQPTSEGGAIAVARDITERKNLERELHRRATRDGLTGLWNRPALTAELERLDNDEVRAGAGIGLLLVDLDNFKEINDTLGHDAGDQVLIEVARRLQATVRNGDFVARLGGDEFAILLSGQSAVDTLGAFADRVLAAVSQPIPREGFELKPSASIGIAISTGYDVRTTELMLAADRGLYLAKQDGRGRWRLAAPEIAGEKTGYGLRAADTIRAFERGEFDVDYQPIIALGTMKVVGLEALVRWRHPVHGRLTASEFIAMIDRESMILPMTLFVLRTALNAQRALSADGWDGLDMWVNLAPACLAWPNLVPSISNEIQTAGGSAQRLVFEVTEGAFAGLRHGQERLSALRDSGARIAIDDFGVEYSSLARLKSLPIDILKLDRRFIADLANDPRDQAIVRAIVSLCRDLNLTVVAEGIELPDQLAIASSLGVRLVQGYLLGPPIALDKLPGWLGGLSAPVSHVPAGEYVAGLLG